MISRYKSVDHTLLIQQLTPFWAQLACSYDLLTPFWAQQLSFLLYLLVTDSDLYFLSIGDQRFAMQDDSSKRMSSCPANSAPCLRDESTAGAPLFWIADVNSNPCT